MSLYIPKSFEVTDKEALCLFIREHGFGQLISTHNGNLFVSHLPFLLNDNKTSLLCHVARQNPQYIDITGQKVLAVFVGPHGYISPTWYASSGVPTWNFQAVHVEGVANVITDGERTKGIIHALSAKYEMLKPDPWKIEYNESMLNHIVGIDIKITDIKGKYKLSQNKSAEDRAGVVEQLYESGNVALAQAMEKHNP